MKFNVVLIVTSDAVQPVIVATSNKQANSLGFGASPSTISVFQETVCPDYTCEMNAACPCFPETVVIYTGLKTPNHKMTINTNVTECIS